MPSTIRIPIETLERIIRYDSETGELFWLHRPPDLFAARIRPGGAASWNTKYSNRPVALHLSGKGYYKIKVFGKFYSAHRVIFALAHRRWPLLAIDHIDGNRLNNCLYNLREATYFDNARNATKPRNNTSGVVGVFWHKVKKCWAASIRENGKHRHLGYFSRKADAVAVRKAAESEVGFHPNHGRVHYSHRRDARTRTSRAAMEVGRAGLSHPSLPEER